MRPLDWNALAASLSNCWEVKLTGKVSTTDRELFGINRISASTTLQVTTKELRITDKGIFFRLSCLQPTKLTSEHKRE